MSDTTLSEANTTSLDRTVAGRPFPATGTYDIDATHSTVSAVARHLMFSKVRGQFGVFSGTVTVGETPAESSVEVVINTESIDTRDEKRDEHLRSNDFLDVENHPEITFRSTSVDPGWVVTGELTMRGVTRQVTLDTEYLGTLKNPWGATVAVFSASTKVNREDFDIVWNAPLEAGGVLVGKELKIEIEIQAARQDS